MTAVLAVGFYAGLVALCAAWVVYLFNRWAGRR